MAEERITIPEAEKLSNPKNTIAVVQGHSFTFRKNFGQNFLIDSHVIDKIVAAAEITEEDEVLEIGPGIGTLTQYLAEAAGHVTAVEIDKNLIPILGETLAPYHNIDVVNQDVLKVDFQELFGDKSFKCVANLPYYITTPIIMELLEKKINAKSITVMVQKEVAERMKAGPGTKDYGALSLAVQYYAKPYIAAYVPQNCFIPRPNVGSAVIRLTRLEKPAVDVKDEKLMFQVIRAAFNQRRKTLSNAVKNFSGFTNKEHGISREQIEGALTNVGFDVRVRGEALTLAEFAAVTDALTDLGIHA